MARKFDDFGDILTPKEVKEILGIGSNKVYSLLLSGQIQNFKIGSVRKIPKWCLTEYINSSLNGIHKKGVDQDDCEP